MNERIKEIRNALGLTMEQFGNRIGVTKAAISRLEKNDRAVTDQMAKSICREYSVHETWFRTGEGPMFVEMDDNEKIAAFMAQVLRDDPDHIRKLILSFIADLDEEDWEDIARIASKMKKS